MLHKEMIVLGLVLLLGCATQPLAQKKNIQGETMGTTYHMSYFGSSLPESVKNSIDSLLVSINDEVSTFIPTSTISRFNTTKSDTNVVALSKEHFWQNLRASQKIFIRTQGFFDPTVMPLVNYWGFGYKGHKLIKKADSLKIDSILHYVGFEKLFIRKDTIFKSHSAVQLDFSACAKGYAIDEVAHWFEANGIKNYYIEIGGENRAAGKKANGKTWSVGLVIPKETTAIGAYHTIITLDNQSMATSGNYRNFYEVEGQKYSHTINPKTGFTERNTLLSASVLANNCLQADALATGIMAMGYKKAKKLYQSLDSVQIILKIGQSDGTIKTEFFGMNKPKNTN